MLIMNKMEKKILHCMTISKMLSQNRGKLDAPSTFMHDLSRQKKNNILTLLLSEKKILNETNNHTPPPPAS